MSHPIDPKKLLKQAEGLAGIDAGRGRPSTEKHRLAVSTAYYALFHDITLTAAQQALPNGAPDDEIQQATRWIDHRDLRSVCDMVARCPPTLMTPPDKLPKGLSQKGVSLWESLSDGRPDGSRVSSLPSSLWLLTVIFRNLQTARHSADYDHRASFPKAKTIVHVNEASFAMARLEEAGKDPYFERFFVWVLAKASRFPL